MARAVLSSIDDLTNMINGEIFYPENIKEKVNCISRELLVLQMFLKEADIEEVTSKLQKIIYDAEATIVNYVLETGVRRRGEPICKRYARCKDFGALARVNFCNEIDQILESIKQIKSEWELDTWFEESSSSHYSGGNSFNLGATLSEWIRPSVDFDEAKEDLSTVVGLRQDMEWLKAQLLGDGHSIISVLGIQGIGKTKLAWEIYKSCFVKKDFLGQAWVCASAMDNDSITIQEDILEQLRRKLKGNGYLIVLDDVCNLKVWSELQKIIPKNVSKSRIILTTRDVEVASSANYPHRLKVLSEEESWELFSRKVFIAPWKLGNASGNKDNTEESPTLNLPPKFESLGKEMVEKCLGIPYLIIGLANLLSTVYPNTVEWSSVLHGINTDLRQDQNPWFNLASTVYDVLPLHVKSFLKCLHQFPEESEIPERRLIRSWCGEELWQQSISGIYGDEAAKGLLQDLQDLNLIQAVKVSSVGITKTYRIHSGPHPLLQILTAGDGKYSSSSSDHVHGKVWIHRLLDYCSDEDPHSRRIHTNINSPEEVEPYKTLHSFWCFDYPVAYKPGQEVGNFLSSCITNNYLWFLRVLDLEGVYKPILPDAIGELINLGYLGLRWTYLDTLPSSVCNLQNLRTLDIKHTEIGDYPMIQNLNKLQHLYLNEWHPRGLVTQLSFLSDLQTLSGVIFVDDSTVQEHGQDKLMKLRKLRLTCQLSKRQESDAMARWIGKLKDLQTLKLTSKDQGDQAMTLSLLLQNLNGNQKLSRMFLRGRLEKLEQHQDHFGSKLTALTLSLTQLSTDPMPILEGLPELKLLRLFSKSFIGKIMHCSKKGFNQLRVLKMWKLEKLEEWTVDNGAMSKLEELEIRSCKMLKMLPDLPQCLRELKLTDMPKEKFTSNVMGKDSQKVAYVRSVVIEDWIDPINTSVELYTGRNCDLQFQKGQLEKLFDLEVFAENLTELTLSEIKLKEDPMSVLEKLPKLRVLILSSKSFTGSRMVCKKGGFMELKQLTIWELEELEELTVEDGSMPKIEELEIRSCKNLKVLPQVPGTIKKLKLVEMPKEFTEKYKANERVNVEISSLVQPS